MEMEASLERKKENLIAFVRELEDERIIEALYELFGDSKDQGNRSIKQQAQDKADIQKAMAVQTSVEAGAFVSQDALFESLHKRFLNSPTKKIG